MRDYVKTESGKHWGPGDKLKALLTSLLLSLAFVSANSVHGFQDCEQSQYGGVVEGL